MPGTEKKTRVSEAQYLDAWDQESDASRADAFKRLRQQRLDRKRRGKALSPHLRDAHAAVLKAAGISRKELDERMDADFEAARKDAASRLKELRRQLPARVAEHRLIFKEILALRRRVSEQEPLR